MVDFGFDEDNLNKGLMSPIENNGSNLNQLEKDLLSIFKIFYTNKNIILIDFFNFSFEDTLEKEIIDYIIEKVKEKTVLIATDNF